MYFLIEGQVEVVKGAKVLAVLKEGTFFGEVAVIKDTVRQAGIRTLKACNLFVLTKTNLDEAFKQLVRSNCYFIFQSN